MTQDELEKLRIQARILALESLVSGLISALVRSQSGRQDFVQELGKWRQSLDRMTFRNVAPEMSDLLAAETQDAIDSLNAFVTSKWKREDGLPPN